MTPPPDLDLPPPSAIAKRVGEDSSELFAEVIVRLGETVLEVHDLHASRDHGLLSQTLRLSGAGLLGLGLILGVLTPAVSATLTCAIAGAALLASGLTTRPLVSDRFRVGEAHDADLALSIRETAEAPPAASLELVRVIDGAVVLRLPADLDGTISGPDDDSEVLEIAALRARGWKNHRLDLGARAIFRRGDLTIEVGAVEAPQPLPAESAREPLDRGILLPQWGALALLALLFVVASTREIDLSAPPELDELRAHLLRAFIALPTPRREEADPRETPPSPPPAVRRDRRSSARPQPAKVEPTPPQEPRAMVEVDGEAVAAPKLARSFRKRQRQRRKGGEVRLEELADGDPGAALLGNMIEDWVAMERESLTHYVDTEEDFDAWAALAQGPPIQRGMGGLDLIGKGRPGGGEAEELDTGSGSRAQTIKVAARPKAQPRGKLRVGAPRTTGALSRAHLSEVARDGRSKLRHCWVDAERRGSSGGAVTLVITIGGDGRVSDAQVKGSLDDPKLAPCLREAVMSWRYERRDDDGTTVSYPVDLDQG